MMKKSLLVASLILLGSSSAWANIIGSTNPADFPDTVDWCLQFGGVGCQGQPFGQPLATPQPWTSAGGQTGLVGLSNTGENFYVLQQDVSWFGNFPANMGLIYNGASFGNVPTQIASTDDQGVSGVGAYIQASFFGPFTATVELFDASFQSLGSFTANGVSDTNVGTALFIGAYDPSANDIWAAQFDVVDQFGQHDFAIGTLGLRQVPEPASLLLMAPGLLAMAAVTRRRKTHKFEEVI